MISCAECKEQLRPTNPTVGGYDPRSGRRLAPICETCVNYTPPPEPEIVDDLDILHEPTSEQQIRDENRQLRQDVAILKREVKYLINKESQRWRRKAESQERFEVKDSV